MKRMIVIAAGLLALGGCKLDKKVPPPDTSMKPIAAPKPLPKGATPATVKKFYGVWRGESLAKLDGHAPRVEGIEHLNLRFEADRIKLFGWQSVLSANAGRLKGALSAVSGTSDGVDLRKVLPALAASGDLDGNWQLAGASANDTKVMVGPRMIDLALGEGGKLTVTDSGSHSTVVFVKGM